MPRRFLESDRLSQLYRLDVLDTDPDPYLDGIVDEAAGVTGCPIAVISLIDRTRQWFKARHGLHLCQSRREYAFCAHTIREPRRLEVLNAAQDPRFANNPLVTGRLHVRYFAGVPIVSRYGARIGALCVIDRTCRAPLPESQWRWLRSGSRAVTAAVEFGKYRVPLPLPPAPSTPSRPHS
ncbi:GAF domain-containing protein [uncultured Croceicoccus sp.]|uniref:GAF domain-containing protein n=1 Tax=uncultured Croceicoccus sp. TaxID=1295329 RepID=UPI0026188428|nr:GAF domain-containing protein [uncultured Croceicoccus sp.]